MSKPRRLGPSPQLTRHSGSLVGPIEYMVVEPANASPTTPIVIALHGRGDKAENFARVAEQLGQRVRTLVARGPVTWGRFNGRQWWNMNRTDADVALADAVDQLATMVGQVAKKYPQAGKPVVYGFSQGGMLALQTLARRPGLFKAVAALSAKLPKDDGNARPTAPQRIPVLVAAGKNDRMVPVAQTRAATKALEALGYGVEVLEFEGGHTISKPVTAALKAFIAKHGPVPDVSATPKPTGKTP